MTVVLRKKLSPLIFILDEEENFGIAVMSISMTLIYFFKDLDKQTKKEA